MASAASSPTANADTLTRSRTPSSLSHSAAPTILQSDSSDPGLQRLHQLHQSLLASIHGAHSQTSQLLQSQEHDLLSAFQTRLLELHNELLQERQKSEVGSSEWIQRCTILTQQSQLMQAKHHQLQQSHTQVKEQYRTLQREYRLLEETRDILVKNLVVLKRQMHQQLEGRVEQADDQRSSGQQAYLRSRPMTAKSTASRPATASRPSRSTASQRPFTASLHQARSPTRWSREWNDRPHSAAVGCGVAYSQSVHQRPKSAARPMHRLSLSSEVSTVTLEQHFKQLLAISHQQQEKLQQRYEQMQRRQQEKQLQDKELSMCMRQAFHRLFVEPYEPMTLKSILQRPASSASSRCRAANRPSSAASVAATASLAPATPTVLQLTSEQRTAVLHQLALEPVFWNFVDSMVNSQTEQVKSPKAKPSRDDALEHLATARTATSSVHARLAELLLADSDDDTSTTPRDGEQEYDEPLMVTQEHKDGGDT